jgi:uncharacterized protein YbjT (DUF2867 family)
MYLVVGATGLLGSEICARLRKGGEKVTALVRSTAKSDSLSRLRDAGVTLVTGDLKDIASLREACRGIAYIVSTASSTFSRQDGDSIETVDLKGQSSLVDAAQDAGIKHFTFISIPRFVTLASPLTRAKSAVEEKLVNSGLPYTILAANYFMEVWLSPAVGFDFRNNRAVIFGNGKQMMSWISYEDVAEFAVRAATTPAARNKRLDIGGPEDLSPLAIVEEFQTAQASKFDIHLVPEQAIRSQLESARDPLEQSFATLQLEYTQGCLSDSSEAMRAMPVERKTVKDYVEQMTSQARRAKA